ncbi:MAG TPA: PfkB family carbohydrate kinase [Chloroflexota bacterium]
MTVEVDYLVIGHVTRDELDGRPAVGGTAAYASLMARNLGLRVGVVTSAGPEIDPQAALPGVLVHSRTAPTSTFFRNNYPGGRREQFLLGCAAPLDMTDVPEAWRSAPLVHLAPVAGEVVPSLAARFPTATVAATLQGWLRRRDETGRVVPIAWPEAPRALTGVHIALFSDEDAVADPGLAERCAASLPIVVVTRGADGATLYDRGRPFNVPACPARVVDPTGAGDVFAAAFLVWLQRTADPVVSARFASCAAACSIEAMGTAGIPTLHQVEERLARWVG